MKLKDKDEDKVQLAFAFAEFIRKAYEDNKEKFTPNEFFTSILIGMYAIYSENFRMDDAPDDIINFTHVLNRLAIQHIMGDEE